MGNENQDGPMTAKEAADLLKVSIRTLERWGVPFYSPGNGKRLIFREELFRFLRESKRAAT